MNRSVIPAFVVLTTIGLGGAWYATTLPLAQADPIPEAVEVALVASGETAAANRQLSVGGSIRYDGPPIERRPINMTKDRVCTEMHQGKPVLGQEVILGSSGELMNVFVYIRKGAPKGDYPIPSTPAVLDQNGCMFSPRVQGVLVGQKLQVKNGDPLTHNVRSFAVRNRPFNFGQPAGTDARERVFKRAERAIEVQCDYHRWMRAFLFSMDHPFFAVTGEDGKFAIFDLPAGEYQLAAWHETLGEQKQTIQVAEQGTSSVSFTFRPKKK